MFLLWIAVGCVIGWFVPQPTLTYAPTGERVGLVKWVYLKARDAVK
jgi:hypothetical protein